MEIPANGFLSGTKVLAGEFSVRITAPGSGSGVQNELRMNADGHGCEKKNEDAAGLNETH